VDLPEAADDDNVDVDVNHDVNHDDLLGRAAEDPPPEPGGGLSSGQQGTRSRGQAAATGMALPPLRKLARTLEVNKRQSRNEAVTEIKQVPNRGHSLTIDSGWREVAQTALDFVKRFV
jgi:hypothetical protein